ncbi:MAG: hypothetical protein WAZ99_09870, partial [Rectinemataceae bacterium]
AQPLSAMTYSPRHLESQASNSLHADSFVNSIILPEMEVYFRFLFCRHGDNLTITLFLRYSIDRIR